jgi:hypothetical protein
MCSTYTIEDLKWEKTNKYLIFLKMALVGGADGVLTGVLCFCPQIINN